jgi:hypothetical protein
MDSENYSNQNKKKRNRPVPLLAWFTGALLTGGFMTFAGLSYENGEIITDLTLRLSENETRYAREKDELYDILGKSNKKYNILNSEHETTLASLDVEQAKNKKLTASNASFIIRESQLQQEVMFLQDSTVKLNSALVSLLAETDLLRGTIQDLQARIENQGQDNSAQESMVLSRTERLLADSASLAEIKDSLIRENVSGFFNNTNITGAYGLKDVSVPYSKYFYGGHTINGYVINRHFMTGIGVGLQAFNDGGLMAPLFLDMRYTVGRNKFQPYLFADGGLLLNFDAIDLPSLFITPGIGFMQKLGGHFAFNVGAGYHMQKDNSLRHSFVNLNMGIVYRKK